MFANNYSAYLFGGLGNQLFQIAYAYAEAKRRGGQLVIPSSFKGQTHDMAGDNAIDSILENGGIEANYSGKPIVFRKGYYQSSLFFKEYEPDIIRLFTPIHPTDQIKTRTAIHIRLGDYCNLPSIHPVISKKYLRNAIEWQFMSGEYPAIDVFSDMPDLAAHCVHSTIRDLGIIATINCIKVGSSVDQFRQLASYRHIIGSNSTFSWWAIWLHRVVDNYCFACLPQNWYGVEGPSQWEEIYPGVTNGSLAIL